ncbi:MAG: hypothetical protein Q8O82_02120 [Pseudorhodobacter sp.]|nr:hypothetical protein [Pseudorhodobacter sp.]
MSDESKVTQEALNEALKTAFWVTDVMVAGLPDLLAFTTAEEMDAERRGDAFSASVAAESRASVEGMAFALGILRTALTDLRLNVPEGHTK